MWSCWLDSREDLGSVLGSTQNIQVTILKKITLAHTNATPPKSAEQTLETTGLKKGLTGPPHFSIPFCWRDEDGQRRLPGGCLQPECPSHLRFGTAGRSLPSLGTQSVIPEAPASPGSALDMQTFGSHAALLDGAVHLSRTPRGSCTHGSSRGPVLAWWFSHLPALRTHTGHLHKRVMPHPTPAGCNCF